MAVKMMNERDRMTLAYLAAVSDAGYGPTRRELNAFAGSPACGFQSGPGIMSLMGGFNGLHYNSFEDDHAHWFLRLGWADSDGSRLFITQLGRAAARAFPPDGVRQDDEEVAVFRPEEQFAYARLISHIAELDDVMLVDPHLRGDQFEDVAKLPNVRRLLVKSGSEAQRGTIEGLAAALRDWSHAPEIRSAEDLHDRYIVSEPGQVRCLGVSLNGISGKLTTIVPLRGSAATVLRDDLNSIWGKAEPVKPALSGPRDGASA